MNNKILEYLLEEDSEEVLSSAGVKIRKAISPLFRQVMMLFTSGKLEVVDKGYVPKDKKVIYAGTHGFHDDIIFSMKVADRHSYLLYGSLLDFFKSFHGLGLWVNGVVLVDRKNKNSRRSSVEKMKCVLEKGTNLIMFPEGTWNKNESLPVQKLYPGIYDVALESGALVVPIATILYGDKAYAIRGDAFDITKIDEEMSSDILNRQINIITKARDLLIYSTKEEEYIRNFLDYLLLSLADSSMIEDALTYSMCFYPKYYDYMIEITDIMKNGGIETLDNDSKLRLIDSISGALGLMTSEIDVFIKARTSSEAVSFSEDKDSLEIEDSILFRTRNLLNVASKQKKIVAVEGLRDRMASLKWELYQDDFRDNLSSNYWEKFIDGQIKSTKGLYDYDIEDVAEYKDPDEVSFDEVFKPIQKVYSNKKVI